MRNKLTKIVATVSDQNCSPEFIKSLYDNGMDVVRLNTAHQSPEDSLKVVNNVRKISDRIAIFVDTKGPEVRTSITDGKVYLKKGNNIKVKFGKKEQISGKDVIYTSYSGIVKDVAEGACILIDDGELELKVIKKKSDYLVCKIMNDGTYKSNKSINVPGVSLKLPSLTKKDKSFVDFAIKHNIDFIAHSFVRNKKDVLSIQRMLDKHKSKVKIIAKIENREGVDNIDEILDNVYGIMIARGDLGIEIPAEEVPIIQKQLIKKCIEKQKSVITATQMLHSMIDNPRPTRAEVNDVASAIFDGTDCVMLSGETAYGSYPMESVRVMSKIAKKAEAERKSINEHSLKQTKLAFTQAQSMVRNFLVRSAIYASLELPVKALVVHTISGTTARVVSAHRGKVPIFAKCFNKRVVRELALNRGVYAYYLKPVTNTDEMIGTALKGLVEEKKLKSNDFIVLLGAMTNKKTQSTDFVEVCSVKEYLPLPSKKNN